MNDTNGLLQEFCATGSESAFQELVTRYLDLVYSVALRRLSGDTHQARDVAQTVFSDLARKAHSLPPDVQLGGWLHHHTCFIASNFARTELRRRTRELEAFHMNAINTPPESSWDELAPALDDALQDLERSDRDALMMRFFERRDLKSVGAVFGVSEDAAQKRVSRAVDKLRQILVQRGVTLSVGALVTMLGSQAIQTAPADWTTVITANALKTLPAKLGLAASIATFVSPFFLKWGAVGVAVALITGALVWNANRSEPNDETGQSQGTAQVANGRTVSSRQALSSVADPNSAAAASSPTAPKNSRFLALTILAAESGQPLANAPIEMRLREGSKSSHQDLVTDSAGVCHVPIPGETITELALITRLDGLADTRLLWRVERGVTIPDSYTLRLDRGVVIGGRVVDPAGQPVADAQVSFQHREDPPMGGTAESHYYGWLVARTASDGSWTLNRIAGTLLAKSNGSAEHTNYIRADAVNFQSNPEVLQLLRAQKHVFSLGQPITIRGVVVDDLGNPVPQADILFGQRGEVSSRTATTELDGTFTLNGCRPGKNLLSAQAPQFAPATLEINAQADSEPFKIVLSAGKTLKLRVVNRQGEPIAGAQLLQAAVEPTEAPALVKASFSMKTDADGRIFWDQAPDREIAFDIAAHGYMRTNEYRVHADNQEHTVILLPALRIHGTVHDAKSGEPVPRFTLIAGRPETSYGTRARAWWSSLARDWITFSDGKFDQTYQEHVVYNEKNPRFMFKIQADGYSPFISRIVEIDEGEVRLDVQLQPATRNIVTVLLPNGQPAPKTDLQLAGPRQHVAIASGALAQNYGVVYLNTDREGKFDFQPDQDTVKLFAANADGFGSATPQELADQPVLRLQTWARLEGTITRRSEPVAGLRIQLNPPPVTIREGDEYIEPFLSVRNFAVTDARGQFNIDKVPPGKFELSYFPALENHSGPIEAVRIQKIELRPGETTRADYAENGADVFITLTWPTNLPTNVKLETYGSISTPPPQPPLALQNDTAALHQWYQRRDTLEQFRARKSWPLLEQPDKRWMAGPVPPGQYILGFQVMAVSPEGNQPLFMAQKQIDIPADTRTIDLGQLQLERVPFKQ